MLENKKGIVPQMLALIVLIVIIAIGAIIFIASTNAKFYIIGIAMIFFSLVYGSKTGYTKNTRKFVVPFFIIGLVLFLIPAFGLTQTIVGVDVFVPQYGNVYCDRTPTQINQDFKLSQTEQTYHCGTGTQSGDVNAYVPYGCIYYPKSNIAYKICLESDECKIGTFAGLFASPTSNPITINQGQKITIRSKSGLFGDYSSLNVKAEPYGLKQSEWGKTLFYKNCDIKNLAIGRPSSSSGTLDYINGGLDTSQLEGFTLPPKDYVANYIIGQTLVKEPRNVINFKNQMIYILAPGQYYKVVKSQAGYYYTDTSKTYTDNDVKCMPSTVYCECSSTTCNLVLPEQKTCTPISGGIEGFVQVSSTEECQYECVNNILTKTNCRKIVTCPSEKPFYNTYTGQCEASGIAPNKTLVCDKFYQELGTQSSYKYEFLFFKFGKVDTPVCKTASWVFGIIIGAIVIILFTIYLLINKPTSKRKK